MFKDIIEDLEYRGLINQSTDLNILKKRIKSGPISFYCGFDPSANSLQLGNLLIIMTAKRFEKYGHKPIMLVGGMTGLIGDPGGRSEERTLEEEEIVKERVLKFKKEMSKFFDFKASAKLVNNYDWFKDISVKDFLRDTGKCFTVSYLLAKEWIKNRLETGISYTEFSYTLIQAYDFYHLFKTYNCELQLEGADQWGNITTGTNLIEQKLNKTAFGLTVPMLVDSSGKKLAKSLGNTVFLSSEITTPYQFYQYFINLEDELAYQWIKYFTFLEKDEIEKLIKEQRKNPETRICQKYLAEYLTEFVHDKKAVMRSKKISDVLFKGEITDLELNELEEAFIDVPCFEVNKKTLKYLELVDLLVDSKFCNSKRQAREDILNKAISINGIIYTDIKEKLSEDKIMFDKYIILKRGKRNYIVIKLI